LTIPEPLYPTVWI